MNKIKLLLIHLICICYLTGCGSVEYKIKYKDVYIPTSTKLYRPVRPTYNIYDNSYSYLLKLLDYTRTLEFIIDKNNEAVK